MVRPVLTIARASRRAMMWSIVGGVAICASGATALDRSATAAQPPAVAIGTEHVDRDELMRVVRTLASPDWQGRRTGSPGGRAARQFIRDAFQKMGLVPAAPGFLRSLELREDLRVH